MNPQELDFPAKFREWRPNQLETIERVANSEKQLYLVEAPTGSGKTAIGYGTHRLKGGKSIYLVSTKQLQMQLAEEFEGKITVMWGRSNYPCAKYKNKFPDVTAEDCSDGIRNSDGIEQICKAKERCAYALAKRRALAAPIACLNYSYFLAEANFVGAFSNYPFVVLDEVDLVERELEQFINLIFTDKELERLDVYSCGQPRYKTVPESWVEWAKSTLPVLIKVRASLSVELGTHFSFSVLKKYRWLDRKISKLSYFIADFSTKGWVFNYEDKKWEFKPVWIRGFAKQKLWQHIEQGLGMSATILDADQLCYSLGISNGMVDYFRLPSLFPVENRPIHYLSVASVTRKNRDNAYAQLVPIIERIIQKHRNEKGLIHAVSYDLSRHLVANLSSTKRIITHNSQDRSTKLAEFKSANEPLVMVSPSMERGVDLPYDQCRFIIVAKIPYPNLGDKQVAARIYGSGEYGQRWYNYATATSLVQSTGRGVRAVDDSCVSYILDTEFERFYQRNCSLLPDWWKDAIKW